jgi:putative DNA methylase
MIELGTLALEASASGAAERYGRGKTSHSGQVWWARRPHAAMRAVVFASIVRDEGKESANLLSRLAIDGEPLEQLLRDAQEMIGGQYPSPPVVLDAFGGGGTIPQEAASLGARVHSRDYNALSVFIQQTNLHFSQSAFKKLGKNKAIFLLRETGAAVLQEAKAKTEVLYPARSKTADCGGTPFAYFWTYKMACPKCTVPFHLSKRFWLSKKTGRHQRISVIRSHLGEKLCLVHGDTHEKADSIWGLQSKRR